MTKLLDSRPDLSFDVDLDLADRLPTNAHLPDRNDVSDFAGAVIGGVMDAVDNVDWADIGDGIAGAADSITGAASVAGRRTSRLARRIGHSGARVGSAASRRMGSTARAARRNPKRTALIGAAAIGALTAVVIMRRRRDAEERPDLGLAHAA